MKYFILAALLLFPACATQPQTQVIADQPTIIYYDKVTIPAKCNNMFKDECITMVASNK